MNAAPMSFPAGKIRVLIATTNGPVEVQLLTEEDPIIGRSVACIGGTTETADIAAAYHAFVARPTGVIEARYGHSCYRLDVSGRIDAGSSWQLGVLAAHALHAAGRLAQENDVADAVLWATGSVRPVDLTVGSVSHVPEKIENSLARLKQERAAGRAVLLAVPAANATEVPATRARELSDLGIEIITVPRVEVLFDGLGPMTLPGGGAKGSTPATPSAARAAPARAATAQSRWYVWASVAALITIVIGAALVFARVWDFSGSSSRPAGPVATATPPSGGAASVKLEPERVPFISTEDRQRIRNDYMPAPNYKALATSLMQIALVSGQPSQEAADRAALEACQKENRESDGACSLYASGDVVVTQRRNPSLPPKPWINATVQRPFVPDEVPLIDAALKAKFKDQVTDRYAAYARSKAVVLSPTGSFFITFAQASPDDAMRRSLERCGFVQHDTCFVRGGSRRHFRACSPDAGQGGRILSARYSPVREPRNAPTMARRLAGAAAGWNAVAVGAEDMPGSPSAPHPRGTPWTAH